MHLAKSKGSWPFLPHTQKLFFIACTWQWLMFWLYFPLWQHNYSSLFGTNVARLFIVSFSFSQLIFCILFVQPQSSLLEFYQLNMMVKWKYNDKRFFFLPPSSEGSSSSRKNILNIKLESWAITIATAIDMRLISIENVSNRMFNNFT